MSRRHLSYLALLLALPIAASAQHAAKPSGQSAAEKLQAPPAWEAAVDARRKQLTAANGPGTDVALRDRLLAMAVTDQAARGFITGKASQGTEQQRIEHLTETDAQLTTELKQIVAAKAWPTISLVGIEASDAAMLLLTHTADHAWQLQLLPQLEQLADGNKIDASPLALVIDKELVAAGKLQRYGTQFKFINGRMAMYAVEDPGNLDAIRSRAMLPPMGFYKDLLARMYGLKPTHDIVGSAPPSTSSAPPKP